METKPYTIAELSDILNLSVNAIYQRISRAKIQPAIKLKGIHYFFKEQFEKDKEIVVVTEKTIHTYYIYESKLNSL